ncbi:MAG: deoxyribonuclease IV [Candidatus Cloacimonadota bacterium]|nr:deoxyribonuclease IV [Candidatus Cloacimonadota bacterium]
MKYIGAHVSIAGGKHNAVTNAVNIGATAFAIFTKSQRQWFSKPLSSDEINHFNQALAESNIKPEHILPHAGYLINLANPDDEKLAKSRKSFAYEIDLCEKLGLPFLNIHPGSTLGKISVDDAIKKISESINIALTNSTDVKVVIENTAGQGNYLGHQFEQISQMIEQVEDKSRVGVCLDSCHMFGAGYDIRDRIGYDKTFTEFENTIGFEYLTGMHLNDSKMALGSRKDRHESLGKGLIGIDFFKMLMADSRFDEIPLILETPNHEIYAEEIKMLFDFYKK